MNREEITRPDIVAMLSQELSPSGKPAAGEKPEAAICIPDSLENNPLLPKAEVFGD